MIAVMQQSINALTQQLNVHKESKNHEVPGAPKIGEKDVKEPAEYSGTEFKNWSVHLYLTYVVETGAGHRH